MTFVMAFFDGGIKKVEFTFTRVAKFCCRVYT